MFHDYPVNVFFATRTVLKIEEYHSDISQFSSWGIFSHVIRLDQSRASDNIWWIMTGNITKTLLVVSYSYHNAGLLYFLLNNAIHVNFCLYRCIF